MSIQPRKPVERIQFAEAHVATWTTNAVAIGSTSAVVTAWAAKVTAARAKFLAHEQAQNAAKVATAEYHEAVEAMSLATANIIQQVKAQAAFVGESVYNLAAIPAPATPAPTPPPGQVTDFAVELQADGSLLLKWKANNPKASQGTVYQIWRRSAGQTEFQYVGGCGQKEFPDATIPAGVTSVTYMIQGVRSSGVGPWNQFNVNFGTSPMSTMTPTVTESVPTSTPTAKKAA